MSLALADLGRLEGKPPQDAQKEFLNRTALNYNILIAKGLASIVRIFCWIKYRNPSQFFAVRSCPSPRRMPGRGRQSGPGRTS
jgi:hypothetical protein